MSAALAVCGLRTASAGESVPVLLFAGAGTSPNDVSAVEAILDGSHLRYAIANSDQLNAMPAATLSGYRLLVVAGGDFVRMGDSLTAETTAKVRTAVTGGVNYLGICAGGFLAGSFPAPYKSFDLTSGVKFGFYSAENSGTRKAAVRIATPDGPALDHYWEDGPQLSGWGDVVGRYPDGTPAIVEGSVGKGWVVLSGVHVEAPASWRRGMTFRTTADADAAYARTLVAAALERTALAHY